MNIDANTIDEIVKRVMAALPTPADGSSSQRLTPEQPKTTNVHTIDAKVITEDVLKGQVQPSSVIQLNEKAVITPSGRDFLRTNNITIAHSIESKRSNNGTTNKWVALVVTTSDAVQSALDNSAIHQTNISDRNELVAESISTICRGTATGVLAISSEPHFVACEANRNQKIRAAVVDQTNQWTDIKTQLSPNVVCVNPKNKTFIETRNLIRQIVG